MNENEIKKILSDLYELDPSLKEREKELVTIIRALAIKPEANYDPAFAVDLRRRLLAELAKTPMNKPAFAEIFGAQMFRYASAALVAIAIFAIAAFSLRHPSSNHQLAFNTSKVSVTDVGANAFGSLATLGGGGSSGNAAAPTAPTAAEKATGASATGMGGGNTASPMMSAQTAPSTGAAMAPDIAMPIRPGYYYSGVEYKYTGDPIAQNEARLNVLKKIPTSLSAEAATAALAQTGFGQIDLSSFGNIGITNVTLSTNEQYGYQIYFDLANGTIFINQDWNTWPQTPVQPLTVSDIPATSTVIGIANKFLSDHHISTAIYGDPQVTAQNYYAVPMAASAPSAPTNAVSPEYIKAGGGVSGTMIPYYPDSEQVLYPLVVNGKAVYSTGGTPIGLTVDVNIRYRRVANVSGLQTQTYQSSAYNALTDASEIQKLAENPQFYPMIYNVMMGAADSAGSGGSGTGSTYNVITYDLGTPTLVYEDMFQSNADNTTSEYLVPAYAFPFVGANGGGNRGSMIMVPLIKDFVQQYQNIILPRPMPMEGGTSGSSGSGSAGTGSAAPGTVTMPNTK